VLLSNFLKFALFLVHPKYEKAAVIYFGLNGLKRLTGNKKQGDFIPSSF
jgi:hypothetical protein